MFSFGLNLPLFPCYTQPKMDSSYRKKDDKKVKWCIPFNIKKSDIKCDTDCIQILQVLL